MREQDKGSCSPCGYWLGFEHLVTGELSQVVESDLVALANFNYDDLGNRTSLTYRNGTSATWEHDAVSRLSSLTQNLAGSTNDLTIGSIGYNPAGQIVSETKSNSSYPLGSQSPRLAVARPGATCRSAAVVVFADKPRPTRKSKVLSTCA